MQEEILSYKELCEKFGEEKIKSRGKARHLQFERWRKEYNIEKIDGKNKYTVTKKRFLEKQQEKKSLTRFKFSDLLEPIIYSTLVNQEDNKIVLTKLEQQVAFGLVNTSYQFKELYTTQIASTMGVDPKDLVKFKTEVWNINNQTIRNIINSMIKKKIVVKYDTYKCIDLNDDEFIAKDNYYLAILEKLNAESIKLTKGIYAEIKDSSIRNIVKEDICKYFGLKTFYPADLYMLDKNAIDFVYKNRVLPKVNDIIENLITINENNCLKISKSKRGKLKEIDKGSMNTMVQHLIAVPTGNIENNYDFEIKNQTPLKIISEVP